MSLNTGIMEKKQRHVSQLQIV